MHLDRNAVTVILYIHNNLSFTAVVDDTSYRHVNVLNRLLARTSSLAANKSIPSIHDDFVENLVKPWIERDFTVNHFAARRIKDPANLLMGLRTTNVGIRKLQNVLAVSMFLILVSHLCIPGQGSPSRVNFCSQFHINF